MKATQTISALRKAAQTAARTTVGIVAEKNPELLATRLAAVPDMANGLKDFDYIVECLIKGGQRDKLTAMLDSRSLGVLARTILTEKLLTM